MNAVLLGANVHSQTEVSQALEPTPAFNQWRISGTSPAGVEVEVNADIFVEAHGLLGVQQWATHWEHQEYVAFAPAATKTLHSTWYHFEIVYPQYQEVGNLNVKYVQQFAFCDSV